jgi:hypothetical protein
MPCSAVVLVLLKDRNDGEGHGMRKAKGIRAVLGVQGMVIEDVTVQVDPDVDEEVLVVSVRPDARGVKSVRSVPSGGARAMTRGWE